MSHTPHQIGIWLGFRGQYPDNFFQGIPTRDPFHAAFLIIFRSFWRFSKFNAMILNTHLIWVVACGAVACRGEVGGWFIPVAHVLSERRATEPTLFVPNRKIKYLNKKNINKKFKYKFTLFRYEN